MQHIYLQIFWKSNTDQLDTVNKCIHRYNNHSL